MVHGVATPEDSGTGPTLFGEDLHDLDGHVCLHGPVIVKAVVIGIEINGGSEGMETGLGAVAHRPIVVNATEVFSLFNDASDR